MVTMPWNAAARYSVPMAIVATSQVWLGSKSKSDASNRSATVVSKWSSMSFRLFSPALDGRINRSIAAGIRRLWSTTQNSRLAWS
jgi:hypothetical protein